MIDNADLEVRADGAKKELSKRAIRELWARGDISYLLHSGQQKIYNSLHENKEAREVCLLISRRFGKTYLCVVLAIMKLLEKPGNSVVIVSPNERQGKKIITPIINKIKKDAPEGLITVTKSEGLWSVGQSTLYLAGMDTAVESLRGLEFQLVIVEETGASAAIDDYDYILKSVLRPTLMHSRGAIIHASTPSKHLDHPFHTITIPKTQASNTFFKYTIEDNPLLSKEDIDAEIEEAGGRDSIHCKREYFCELVRDSSLVAISEFNLTKVVDFAIPEYCNFWISGDVGGVRDKSVFHILGYDYEEARVLVFDELVFPRNTTTSEMVSSLKALERRYGVKQGLRYIDCPGQLRIDLAQDHDFSLSILPKEKGSFEAGLNQLNVAFRAGELVVHPRCKFTILSLENGRLNEQRNDFARTEELGHCDAIASIVYGWRTRIKDVPKKRNKALDGVQKENIFYLKSGTDRHPLEAILDE